MAGTFSRRIRELADQVGAGDLTGAVEVDQVYAAVQHERLDYNHPRGGQAKYLEQPLYDQHRDYLQSVADRVLDGEAEDAMTDAMEDLSGTVRTTAPVLYVNLRESGHPTVTDNGSVVYDRAPVQRRLTDAELRELRRTRPDG